MPTQLSIPILFIGISAQDEPLTSLDHRIIHQLEQFTPDLRSTILVVPTRIAASQLFQDKFHSFQKQDDKKFYLIVIHDAEDTSILKQLIRDLPLFRILKGIHDPLLEMSLLDASEKSLLDIQKQQLKKLVDEQNEKLRNLQLQLETRIQKRTRYLQEARRKSLRAQDQLELMRQATVVVHNSDSIGEIETRLLELLASDFRLDGLRIHPSSSPLSTTFLKKKTKDNSSLFSHQVVLYNAQDDVQGTLAVFRNLKLSSDEEEFFDLLAETISPALQRINTLQAHESFKEEWEATFNAVSDSVVIFDENYEIIQANLAVQKLTPDDQTPIGMKCYQVLFGRDQVCPNCKRGEKFRLENKKETFDVSGQVVHLSLDDKPVYVHQYHDMTEQSRMERKIFESARLAELGTIGSSIAHELNNPLGGILSYVQIIKMDLKLDDPLRPDIEEMEKGVLRCRDIVQNLLTFTRSPGNEQKTDFDLRDVIKRAVGILALKTKSQGIEIKVQIPSVALPTNGHMNMLTQAFQSILQSAVNSIQEKIRIQKGFQPILEIKIQVVENDYLVQIVDNGIGPENAPNLEIPLAQRILLEHGSSLELSFQSKALRLAKISIPRLVLAP